MSACEVYKVIDQKQCADSAASKFGPNSIFSEGAEINSVFTDIAVGIEQLANIAFQAMIKTSSRSSMWQLASIIFISTRMQLIQKKTVQHDGSTIVAEVA